MIGGVHDRPARVINLLIRTTPSAPRTMVSRQAVLLRSDAGSATKWSHPGSVSRGQSARLRIAGVVDRVFDTFISVGGEPLQQVHRSIVSAQQARRTFSSGRLSRGRTAVNSPPTAAGSSSSSTPGDVSRRDTEQARRITGTRRPELNLTFRIQAGNGHSEVRLSPQGILLFASTRIPATTGTSVISHRVRPQPTKRQG